MRVPQDDRKIMKLSAKHFFWTLFIGGGMLLGIFFSLPDGKLHAYFCSVGQGDAIYIRMPNQNDVLIDGGPNAQVLNCLGRHMPFYDRTLELVVMTHPQKDHFGGLIDVLGRYNVQNFMTIPLTNDTDSFHALVKIWKEKKIIPRYLTTGQQIRFGSATMSVIWPQKEWLVGSLGITDNGLASLSSKGESRQVLGYATDKDLNLFSLYLHLQYGNFDTLFTGDGDQSTQVAIQETGVWSLLPENIEVLKVPHHGSKTGMIDEFIHRLQPKLSIIEVGKNSYGHPNKEVIEKLSAWGKVVRTDKNGDIEVVSDGKKWWVR